MKYVVLGSRGMLGSVLLRKLKEAKLDTYAFESRIKSTADIPDFRNKTVFNCIGAIPQKKPEDADMAWSNTLLPHLLASRCGYLVHFSTDCVFNGLNNPGAYSPDSTDHETGIYGLSKRLGEPVQYPNAVTIRTSIIGHNGPSGLLDWFLKSSGTVQGYTDHFWNGFTTNELSNIVIGNLENLGTGLIQLGSDCISKYDLLSTIKDTYGIQTTVQPFATGTKTNKCLENSGRKLVRDYKTHKQMIVEMHLEATRWNL